MTRSATLGSVPGIQTLTKLGLHIPPQIAARITGRRT
jgi:hypothetical protein